MSNFSVVDGDIRLTTSGGGQLLHTDDQNRLKVVMDMVCDPHTLSGIDHLGQLSDSQVMSSNVTQHESYIDHNNLTNYLVGEHRTINDGGATSTDLWSASKISSEIASSSGTTDHSALNNLDYASAGHTGFSHDAHLHDDRYYTETELDAGQLDNRYYTESEIDTISGSLSTEIDSDISTHTSNTDAHHTESHTITSHSDITDATGANLEELTGGGDTTLHDHDGISENTAARHTESHNIASHSDTTATGAELDTLTDGSDTSLHIHDSRYYTESEVDTISGSLQTNIDGKADTSHTHIASDTTDFSEATDDRVNNLLVAGDNISLDYNDVANTLTISGSAGGSGGGLSWSIISTNTTASKDNGYLINATSGNVTLTLPLSPAEGDSVGVCDFYNKATTNTITIARNSSNIEGSATDLILDMDGSGFTMVYTDSTRGWEIVGEITGAGGSGHVHSKLVASDGSPDPALSIDVDGKASFPTGTGINEFSTDGTLTNDSDDAVPTEKAVKTYVDKNPYVMLTSSGTYEGKVMTVTVDDASAVFGSTLYCASDFHYERCGADSTATMPCRCLSLEFGSGAKKILLEGQVCNTSWNWIAGDIYVSETTGGITQTTVTGSGDQVQRIGWALSADTIYFRPDSSVVEVA